MNSYSPLNRLLLAMPPRNLKQLMPDLEFIRCHSEQILLDADDSLDQVFFPDRGLISVMAVYADGGVIEMATIGREGCTGVQAVLVSRIQQRGFWSKFLLALPECPAPRSIVQ